jgi:septum formation protein
MHAVNRHVYLASRSARRRDLLKQIGIGFEVLLLREGPGRATDFDEAPRAGEAPQDYALRVARAKSEAGWARLSQRRLLRLPVISADTTVAVDGESLGKPADREQAISFLQHLSGRVHQVHTAVALTFEGKSESVLSTTDVHFRELPEQEIRHYIATGEPFDKAGGYAIQGRAAVFIRAISGSYSGVMGLPLFETSQLLAKYGYATF